MTQSRYDQILAELQSTIADMERRGITVKPLAELLEQLTKHAGNIYEVEQHMDAIREEVIDRIKVQLDQNKRAGRFSIAGFWLGAIGILITIVGITYTSFFTSPKSVPQDLFVSRRSMIPNSTSDTVSSTHSDIPADHLEQLLSALAFEYLQTRQRFAPSTGDIIIELRDTKALLVTPDSNRISLQLRDIDEFKSENDKLVPAATFLFFVNSRAIGGSGLSNFVLRRGSHNLSSYTYTPGALVVAEGDTLVFLRSYSYQVARVFRTRSNILSMTDDRDAVLLRYLKR